MAKLSGPEIGERAKAIVAENPGGIRFRALVDRIKQESPETPEPTIGANIIELANTCPVSVLRKADAGRTQ